MKKRILATILAALMLLSALTACANELSDGETVPDTAASTDLQTEAESLVTDDLPSDLKYGGDEIIIISRDLEGWTTGEISVEALSDELVNDGCMNAIKRLRRGWG